jgi:hypothetical protein
MALRTSSKAHLAKLLTQKLASSSKRIFSPADLIEIFAELRTEWGLPKNITMDKFRTLALESEALKEIRLTATYPLHTARYHSSKFTAYELALSLRPDSYLSHGTAALGVVSGACKAGVLPIGYNGLGNRCRAESICLVSGNSRTLSGTTYAIRVNLYPPVACTGC